jgi:hypothetical protein
MKQICYAMELLAFGNLSGIDIVTGSMMGEIFDRLEETDYLVTVISPSI